MEEKNPLNKASKEDSQLTTNDNIKVLLYLVEDLKMKVINQAEFAPFQIMVINSIMRAIEEKEICLGMEEQEFHKISIHTGTENKPPKLSWM